MSRVNMPWVSKQWQCMWTWNNSTNWWPSATKSMKIFQIPVLMSVFPDFFFPTHIVSLSTKQIFLLNYYSVNLYFLFPRELKPYIRVEKVNVLRTGKWTINGNIFFTVDHKTLLISSFYIWSKKDCFSSALFSYCIWSILC